MKENIKVENYEIALSYAHADLSIAELVGKELINIFADKFFMDTHKPYELASADDFTAKLANIFRNADYAVILYSKKYNEGEFAKVERDALVDNAEKKNDYSHIFIININGYEVYEKLSKCTYILLEAPEDGNSKSIKEQINYIINKKIKEYIIKKTIYETKKSTEYSFNIQTLESDSNPFRWKTDYDWNLLGGAYIGEDGKKIKDGSSWEEFWGYIKNEFTLIKDNLDMLPGVVFKLHLNCHLSIAYKLGQMYGDLWQQPRKRNLILASSIKSEDISFIFEKEINCEVPDDFCIEYEGNNLKSLDIACIISIKQEKNEQILETVKQFLDNSKIECSKICLFQKKIIIEDVSTLEGIGQYLREKMKELRIRTGSECTIHLFADTAAPLMFVLSAKTNFPGVVKLYEYIPKINSYEFSLEG